jgi:hypothetical protein
MPQAWPLRDALLELMCNAHKLAGLLAEKFKTSRAKWTTVGESSDDAGRVTNPVQQPVRKLN